MVLNTVVMHHHDVCRVIPSVVNLLVYNPTVCGIVVICVVADS